MNPDAPPAGGPAVVAPTAPPALGPGRWSEGRGQVYDRRLCAAALAAGAALGLLVVVCTAGGLYRGWWALAFAIVAYAAFLWPAWRLACRLDARQAARRPSYARELLDGLWLGRAARLTCWLVAVVGLVLLVPYATRWAPPSPRDRKIDDLLAKAAERTNTFLLTRPNPTTVGERGKAAFLARAEEQAANFVNGGPPPDIFAVPSTGDLPPLDPGKPWLDPIANFGDDPAYGYDPAAPKLPTKTTRVSTYQHVRDAKTTNGLGLGPFGFPIELVFSLIGWGSKTTYADRILKKVHSVVEGTVLTADELYELLDDVPTTGLSQWQKQFEQVIDEAKMHGKLTEENAKKLRENLTVAVTRASQERQKAQAELSKNIVEFVKSELARSRTPEQVADGVRAMLPGDYRGRFPSTQFANDLKARLLPVLGGKLEYWNALDDKLKPTDS